MEDEERIKVLKEQLKMNLEEMDRIERTDLLRKIMYSKITKTKDKNDIEKCREMDELSQKVIELATRIIKDREFEEQKKLYAIIKENYQFRGRRHFRDFLIAVEWNFEEDMKFYAIRRIVFDEWIEYLQALEEGRLRGLSISAPPRTRKSFKYG